MAAALAALVLALGASATAAGAGGSFLPFWTALGGDVACGIAIHPPNSPPMQLLCASAVIPPPAHGGGEGAGDPGFVFISSVGRPTRARLSQDSFVQTGQARLRAGATWGALGPIAVTCRVSRQALRCENRSRHGFLITRHSYRAF